MRNVDKSVLSGVRGGTPSGQGEMDKTMGKGNNGEGRVIWAKKKSKCKDTEASSICMIFFTGVMSLSMLQSQCS